VNLLPNQPFQGTACKRRSALLRAAYAAPERRRWEPESNSRTQAVGAIGSGRRIMAT